MAYESQSLGIPRLASPPYFKRYAIDVLSPEYSTPTDATGYALDLTRAIADARGGVLYFPAATYHITANVAVPSDVTVQFAPGALLSIDAGITFTINGAVIAKRYQWITGAGSVVFGRKVGAVCVEWWGADATGTADSYAAMQAAARTGHDLLFTNGASYKTSAAVLLTSSGQRVYAGGANITTTGPTVSVFLVGYDGAAFVKTDDVQFIGGNFTGLADGVTSAPPYAIGVYGPSVVPYAEGAGCSRITLKNVRETGFCYGLAATGADDVRVTRSTFGGNRYYLGLGAGGYGVLAQTCFNVKVSKNTFKAQANDRHAIYISADPNRAFDNNNICKDVVLSGNRVDWRGVGGTTGFEAAFAIRSPENITIRGNIVRGGYGGVDYDAENGNGSNVVISSNVFDGTIAGASERSCINVTRSSGAYVTDTVVIANNTLRPSGPNMYGITLSAVNNVTVTGNVGKISASVALVGIVGNATNITIGGNTWNNNAQYVYLISGANSDIRFNSDSIVLTGGGLKFRWFTFPTRVTFGYVRTAQVSANASGTGIVNSDPDGIISGLSSDPSGIVVTMQGNVSAPTPERVLPSSQASNVGQLYTRSIAGQAVTLGVSSTAFAPLPSNANSYSLTIAVTS